LVVREPKERRGSTKPRPTTSFTLAAVELSASGAEATSGFLPRGTEGSLALFRFSQSVGLLDRTEADALRRTAQETGQRLIDILLQRIDDKRLAE